MGWGRNKVLFMLTQGSLCESLPVLGDNIISLVLGKQLLKSHKQQRRFIRFLHHKGSSIFITLLILIFPFRVSFLKKNTERKPRKWHCRYIIFVFAWMTVLFRQLFFKIPKEVLLACLHHVFSLFVERPCECD